MVMRPALINVMAKAAEKAGKSLVRDFGEVEHLQVSRKGPADFVTNADFKSQSILREELSKARPSFGFVMEEADGAADTSGASERWIVDPLDGTANYMHGVPHWCISIGVERDGEIVSGMIYNPLSDEMFWAEKGVGAYCSSTRIRVSARQDLSECMISNDLSFRGGQKAIAKTLGEIQAISVHVADVRRFGSAALNLAYVAAGRFDGAWLENLGMYDVAAGYIIVKEAGGFVSPMEKGQDPVKTASLIASNANIHDRLVKIIRDAGK